MSVDIDARSTARFARYGSVHRPGGGPEPPPRRAAGGQFGPPRTPERSPSGTGRARCDAVEPTRGDRATRQRDGTGGARLPFPPAWLGASSGRAPSRPRHSARVRRRSPGAPGARPRPGTIGQVAAAGPGLPPRSAARGRPATGSCPRPRRPAPVTFTTCGDVPATSSGAGTHRVPPPRGRAAPTAGAAARPVPERADPRPPRPSRARDGRPEQGRSAGARLVEPPTESGRQRCRHGIEGGVELPEP